MGRKKLAQVLYCHMNDQYVGTLTRTKGQLTFRYAATWLAHSAVRPLSLSLPLSGHSLSGEKVSAYFDNLLPDEKAVREAIRDNVGAASSQPFDLLSSIGKDCVGAIAFTDSEQPVALSVPKVQPLDESGVAKQIKAARTGKALGMDDEGDFRLSLAGAQDKTALTFWRGKWCKPVGTTPTTHILKPRIRSYTDDVDLSDSVENEWFCLAYLRELGMPVVNADIMRFEDEEVLVVERFDRLIKNNFIIRLPQEDFCQALGVTSAAKYQDKGGPGAADVMGLLATSLSPVADQQAFMMAQYVFWLLAAIDGHAKNFSLFLRPQGHKLTPLYDVISAHSWMGQGNLQPRKIKMAMAVNSKNRHYRWHDIIHRHWLAHANSMNYSPKRMEEMIEQVIEGTPQALESAMQQAQLISPRALEVGEKIRSGVMQTIKKKTK